MIPEGALAPQALENAGARPDAMYDRVHAVVNLALFDFDGTITIGDSWTPFLRFAVPPARLALGRVVLAPVVLAYRSGLIRAGLGRRLAVWIAFTGVSADVVQRRGVDYATQMLPMVVRSEVLERIAWHKREGDRVVVVSASLNVYLAVWCEAHRLECVCTTLEQRGGRLTGRCLDGDCSGVEKARRIRARYELDTYPVIYAYGDSDDDREMLALAHRKYFRGRERSAPR